MASSIDSMFGNISRNLSDEFDRKSGKEIRLGKAKSLSLFNEFNDLSSVIQTNRASAIAKIERVNSTISLLKDRVIHLRQQLLIEKSKSSVNSVLISSLEVQLAEFQDMITQFQSKELVDVQNLSLQSELDEISNNFYSLQQISDDLYQQVEFKDVRILELENLVLELRHINQFKNEYVG